jgi:cobalt-zinc-cadmium efflux system membrane fusion protein
LTAAQQAKIDVQTIALSTFRPTLQTTGTIAFNGDHSTQILAPISGPVAQIRVQPGTYVSKGTPLATVASPDFADAVATYRKADAAAKNVQRIEQQDEQLFKADALARRDLEQAQTDVASAIADREAALEQIHALGVDSATINAIETNPNVHDVPAVIRAPISGTVVERLITPGQLLEAGSTPTFTIADLSTVWVYANVFESDLAMVHKGESATITTDVTPTPFSGTVDYVAALVDPSSRATGVRIVVRNRADLLKRDMFVRVAIQGANTRTGILVPSSAVLRDEDNLPFVFIASGQNSYVHRRVELGSHVGNQYEITSGLNVGDKVVTNGALFLQFAETQ